jgi:hypothetical protein
VKPPILFAATLRHALAMAGHTPGAVTRTGKSWAFTIGTAPAQIRITVGPA